ncbi:unnamed protein product [Linum trigynum]|uniref:Uncharacterized protein n=1 Tax=Linum trigynum TaxID=586398 RepID=A0AAV2FRW0_9ROSI
MPVSFPSMRKTAFALHAFNVKTSNPMDVASDPIIGLMCLLWWQEAINKIYPNRSMEQPIAQVLASTIFHHKISKADLKF